MRMSTEARRHAYRIVDWGPGDLALLRALRGDPEMNLHLGGPEAPEKIVERQSRYEKIQESGTGRMFKIVEVETGEGVGSVGYWDTTWNGTEVYETGWSVLPAYQGRGAATEGTAQAIGSARVEAKHRFIHAFPSVDNDASNAICRKLGFSLMGECDFEFPPGNLMRCNDWRLDLEATG